MGLRNQVVAAADRVLARKHCSSCNSERPIAEGRMVLRGHIRRWECNGCRERRRQRMLERQAVNG